MAKAHGVTDDGNVPPNLRDDDRTTYVLRDRIWSPPNRENNWAAFCLVGREGSGKSHTCARILEDVDPTFDASRVFFDPVDLIEFISDLDKKDRAGKAIMLDEAGVGMGVRSWYDSDQIKVNKAMQTLRDDNMILGATIPSFTQLDSQMRTRLHGLCEMRKLYDGDYAVWSWKDIVVNRIEEGNSDIKRKVFPRRRMGGRLEKIERLAIGPPSDEFLEEYERRKHEFKQAYMDEVTGADEDGEDESMSPSELADAIVDGDEPDMAEFTSVNGNTGERYVDKDRIYEHYDFVTHREARTVKALLDDEWEDRDD